ncbi:M23 family metallopeptidase [Nonomuraea solani]|uniref:M23 family metallopeptidase n=1 Tax=Nonomuraea solani TaxID=1144553 RepID=UPI00190EEBFC
MNLAPAALTLAHPTTQAANTSNTHSPALYQPQPTAAVPSTSHKTKSIATPIRRSLLAAVISATVVLQLPALPARASPPTWRWPLDGQPRVLRRFSPPPQPWLAGHRGIDLAAPTSTPVRAAGAGTIRFAGPVAGKGVVTIDHEDGLRTTYLPVTASVRRGDSVTPGTKLGVLEAAKPHCQESCLHWGLLRDARYLNPLLLLGQAPARLLPFWPSTTTASPPNAITAPPETTAAAAAAVQPPTLAVADSPITPALTSYLPPGSSALFPFTSALHVTSPAAPPNRALQPRPETPASRPETAQGTIRPPQLQAATLAPAATTPESNQPPHSTATTRLLTRSTSTPTTSVIGIGVLLGAILLVTALHRRLRRSRLRTAQHHPPRGQHRKQRPRNGARNRRKRRGRASSKHGHKPGAQGEDRTRPAEDPKDPNARDPKKAEDGECHIDLQPPLRHRSAAIAPISSPVTTTPVPLTTHRLATRLHLRRSTSGVTGGR